MQQAHGVLVAGLMSLGKALLHGGGRIGDRIGRGLRHAPRGLRAVAEKYTPDDLIHRNTP